MAAADTAMIVAISAALGGFKPMSTVSMNINFMRVVRKGDVLITADHGNAETMLESKAVVQVEQGGRKAIVTTEFSNYKTIDGISVPMHVRQVLNGKPLTEVTYDRVEFNIAIPDSMFAKPVQ